MKSVKRASIAGMVAVVLVVLLAGCTIAYVTVPGPGKGRPPAKRGLPFPMIANKAADYIGDVTIIGRGIGVTRIRGNVTISGNNADLRGTRIQGKVRSAGKNNLW